MNKNYIIYIIIAITFVVPIILMIPIGFIMLLALIPLIPYFISMEFLYKIRNHVFYLEKKEIKKSIKKKMMMVLY